MMQTKARSLFILKLLYKTADLKPFKRNINRTTVNLLNGSE